MYELKHRNGSSFRPYQYMIRDFILNVPKCAVWSFMGSGKTVSTLTALDTIQMSGLEERPALVVAPLRVARDVWTNEIHEWPHLEHMKIVPVLGTPHQRLDALRKHADVYTINFENLEWLIGTLWDRWPFGSIVIDECFAKGTLVSTPSGEIPIERVKQGDVVLNATGEGTVRNVMTRDVNEIACVTTSVGKTWCSTRHRFFTNRGWVAAKDLTEGDILYERNDCMRILRRGVSEEDVRVEILREILLGEMEDASTSASCESIYDRTECQTERQSCEILHNPIRSEGPPCRDNTKYQFGKNSLRFNQSESVEVSTNDKASTRTAGWEWERNEYSTVHFMESARSRMDSRARRSDQVESIKTVSLQDRPCVSVQEDRRRDRWVHTFCGPHPDQRSTEGGPIKGVRVESVSIYKSGSAEFLGKSGGRDSIVLYDLEVSEHPSFFAEGVLVHNCTKIKSLRASVRKNKQGTEFVAGQGGARAKALLKVVYQHKPSRFIELSGTPASKGLQDLWGQIYFLDYGKRLGNVFEAFKNRWFRQSYDGFSIEPQPFAQEQIQDQLKDICLALKSEDWFDLEKPIQRDIVIELPTEARRMYRDMERTLLAEIANGHKIEAFNAGARTMKCRQLAAGAAYLGKPGELPGKREWAEIHDAKLDALEEIVEECGGAPILVAYNFKSDLERLMKRFKHGRHLDNKPQTIKDWNAGKIPILFSHPESAGHGLNLQHGGNILVYFSFDWKAEPYAQIAERIGPVRQAQAGYKRNVYIYRIIAKNTVEEDIIDVLEKNRSIEETLMNGLKRRVG